MFYPITHLTAFADIIYNRKKLSEASIMHDMFQFMHVSDLFDPESVGTRFTTSYTL